MSNNLDPHNWIFQWESKTTLKNWISFLGTIPASFNLHGSSFYETEIILQTYLQDFILRKSLGWVRNSVCPFPCTPPWCHALPVGYHWNVLREGSASSHPGERAWAPRRREGPPVLHSWKVKVAQLCPTLRPHGLYSPWDSPGQNAGVGSLSLLQGTFPTQGSNPGLPHCRQILYQLSHKGSPRTLEWVAYPFSSRSSQPRNWTRVSRIASRFFTDWPIREAWLEEIQKGKSHLRRMFGEVCYVWGRCCPLSHLWIPPWYLHCTWKQFNEWTELSEDTNRNRYIFLLPWLPACSDGSPSFPF